jgi:hypothetical protein
MLLRSIFILLVSSACAWPQTPAIPDTPAGHTLQAWLDAFNSGDRARIQAYIAKYEPTGAVDETVGFREQTGGFDLLGIDKSERLHIEFRVKEKASPTTAVGKIDVSDADPAVVTSFGLRAIPPGMTAADMNMKIDAATRTRVIDGVVANLNEFYVLVRMTVRRFTRLTNAFSKKIENHCAAVALGYFAYNFIKIHRTLRVTPAMAAGVTDRLWEVSDLVAAWEASERRVERPAA